MATQRDSSQSDLSPRNVAERLKEEGKQRLDRGKSTAADQVDQVAKALQSAGDELSRSPLASYANQLAGSIGRFGTKLREGSIEDLAADMQNAARRNPTLFLAGGLALGVVLARIVKASSANEEPRLVGSDFDHEDLSPDAPGHRSEMPDVPTLDMTGELYSSESDRPQRSYGE
jgi:hypothetical protein